MKTRKTRRPAPKANSVTIPIASRPAEPELELVQGSRAGIERLNQATATLLAAEELPPMLHTKLGQLQTFVQRCDALLVPYAALSIEELRQPWEHYPTRTDKLVHDLRNKYLCIGPLVREVNAADGVPFNPQGRDLLNRLQTEFHELEALMSGPRPSRAAAAPILPIEPAVRPKESTLAAARSLTGRILVVDDEEGIRQRITSCLQSWGHTTIEAATSEEAEKIIKDPASKLDLILLDLDLGDSQPSGLDMLQQIQQDFELRVIPVIVVSGSHQKGTITDCIALGADDYLEKGFLHDDIQTRPESYELLRARVFACLRKGKMQRNEIGLRQRYLAAQRSANSLLYKVFPYMIAEELRTTHKVEPRQYENVAVMFSDVVGFTRYCEGRSALEIVGKLNELFSLYDDIMEEFHVEKIKTIGDCLMASAGLLRSFDNAALTLLQCADAMRKRMVERKLDFEIRTGIHAGPVVAGMVGRQMTFDVWGDTVNTAQRVETAAPPSGIVLSVDAWSQVYASCRGRSLGFAELKGKMPVELFQFDGFKSPE